MRFANHICCLRFRQCHSFWLPQKAQISPCGNLLAVSQLAVEEYETLHDTFHLERDLRTEAENYARAVSFCLFVCLYSLPCSYSPSSSWCFPRWWSSKRSWRDRVRSWCRAPHQVRLCRMPSARWPDWQRNWRHRGWSTRARSDIRDVLDVAWNRPVKIMNFLFNTKNCPLHTDVYKATTGWSDKITPD